MRCIVSLAVVLLVTAAPPPVRAQKAVEAPLATVGAADICEIGVAEGVLDAGGVRATLYNVGNLFWRGSASVYEVPKGSGNRTLFTAGLWVGGLAGDELRFAGSRYGPWEYWPGPLDADGAATADLCSTFDRIWVVATSDLAAFQADGTASADLAAWPVGAGAPFFVDADVDGAQGDAEPTVELRPGDAAYDPARRIDLAAGERPVVSGAQTAWWVMNDRGGEHGWSEAPPLSLEVRVTAWTLADSDRASLYESTFFRYDLLNRSADALDGVFAGVYVDGELGGFSDDFVHTDSTRSMLVFYNGDEFDEGSSGYGIPPAFGIDVLSGASGSRRVWKPSGFRPAAGAAGAYDYLRSLWGDGSHLIVGGTGRGYLDTGEGEWTHWDVSGDPTQLAYWSEENIDGEGTRYYQGKRNGLISDSLDSLAPGASWTLDVAFLFAQGADRLDSVTRLRGVSDDAQAAYASGDLFRPVAVAGPPPPPPAPTAAPVLVAPAEGAVFAETPAPFEWTAVDGATGYWVEVSAAPSFEDPARRYTRAARLDALFGPANRTDPIHWRVVPTNLGSEGVPSEAREITLYYYAPGPMTFGDGSYAFVEVAGPGGVDPCGPEAGSTDGCAEVFGNGIYRSPNSTGDYIGGSVGDGSEATVGEFSPSDFEIRFTVEGSIAYYPFSTGALIHVPFEVWDIGQVAPGDANDPADDIQMIANLFADDGLDECVFDYGGPTQFGLGEITQRIYAYYPTDDYDAFEAEAAPLIEADSDGCPAHPATASAGGRIDFGRSRPLQRLVLEQASDAGIDALEGTVIRFYTADRLPVAAADRPEAGGLAVSVRPNPSASVATVDYRLAEAGPVRLRLVDVLGREVAVLAQGDRAAGDHRASIDAAALASGVYLVVLQSGAQRAVRTLTVVR